MEKKQLKINKRLPQIVLPANKMKMFADWWNEDIRFEKTIPHSFEEGYLTIENEHRMKAENFTDLIKMTARSFNTTYRNIENQMIEFLDNMKSITLYFKFINENSMYCEAYDKSGNMVSAIKFKIGEKSEPEKTIDFFKENYNGELDYAGCKSLDDVLNIYNMQFIYYLSTCLWYIATTSNNTQYVYEKENPIITSRHKNIVKVSDTKTICTPVYDMTKIRTINVDRLITRKKGWTYSHSFQVHGHYRHYKNGKVIFINSFVKGKDKEFKSQKIILEPNKIKEMI